MAEERDIKEAWRLYHECKDKLDTYEQLLREALPHLERGQPILYFKIVTTLEGKEKWQGIKI